MVRDAQFRSVAMGGHARSVLPSPIWHGDKAACLGGDQGMKRSRGEGVDWILTSLLSVSAGAPSSTTASVGHSRTSGS